MHAIQGQEQASGSGSVPKPRPFSHGENVPTKPFGYSTHAHTHARIYAHPATYAPTCTCTPHRHTQRCQEAWKVPHIYGNKANLFNQALEACNTMFGRAAVRIPVSTLANPVRRFTNH